MVHIIFFFQSLPQRCRGMRNKVQGVPSYDSKSANYFVRACKSVSLSWGQPSHSEVYSRKSCFSTSIYLSYSFSNSAGIQKFIYISPHLNIYHCALLKKEQYALSGSRQYTSYTPLDEFHHIQFYLLPSERFPDCLFCCSGATVSSVSEMDLV